MKTLNTTTRRKKALGITLAGGAVAATALVGISTVAQAQPPAHAPAHGYYKNHPDYRADRDDRDRRGNRDRDGRWNRDRDDDDRDGRRDRDRDGRWDRDRDGRWDRDRNNASRLNGIVTRALGNGVYDVRADNGRTYRVTFHRDSPSNTLTVGERVNLPGTYNRDNFIANTAGVNTPLPGNYNGSNGAYLTGVVTRVLGNGVYDVRADNGRTYRVTFHRNSPSNTLTLGERVNLPGTFNRDNFIANTAGVNTPFPGNNNPPYGYNPVPGWRNVNFPGTVVSVRTSNRVTVRGDNGQTYDVTARSNLSVRNGDRVRVTGQAKDNTVTTATVLPLNTYDRYGTNNGYGNDTGYQNTNGNVDFTGIVESSSISSFRVRGDNGQTYEVRYNASLLMRQGQRVRVQGTFDGNIITATDVNRL